MTASASPLNRCRRISGQSSRRRANTSATNSMTRVSPQPRYTSPPSVWSSSWNAASVRSMRSIISCARLRRYAPSSVSVTFFLPRTSSCLPSWRSRSIICFDSVGCVTCSDSAARVMLCSRAMAKK